MTIHFKDLNKSFIRDLPCPSFLPVAGRCGLTYYLCIFYSPKGDKTKDHQNSASIYGTNHCRLQHRHASAFSPHWRQERQNHSRHPIPFHNLGDISQNIGISREAPQLPTATKEEKKGLKLGYMYLSCSQVRQQ